MIARILTMLRKDIRRLWPNVLVFWSVMVSVGVVSRSANRSDFYARELFQALPLFQWLACVLLIVALIHEERLVGYEQYWLTRPIAWPELIAAKAIFVAAMVNLPVWIWLHTGYRGWFADQLPLTAFLVLPAVAFAAVTRHAGQPILLFAGGVFGWEIVSPSVRDSMAAAPRHPILAASIAAIALGAILLQYSMRRNLVARLILLTGVVAIAVCFHF